MLSEQKNGNKPMAEFRAAAGPAEYLAPIV